MTDRTRLTPFERLSFAKRLAQLTKAGIPLAESVAMLEEHMPGARMASLLAAVRGDLERGLSLAASLTRFPKSFAQFEVSVVAIGEASGTLPASLAYLAEELGKRRALRRKVIGSLIYPALITGATLLITGFLMLYLFPRIMPVFISLHTALPLTTRIMIAVSGFLLRYGVLLALACALVIAILTFVIRRNIHLQERLASLMLTIPLIGGLVRDYELTVSLRTLGMLLTRGMPVLEATTRAGRASGHPLYRQAYEEVAEALVRGERFSSPLALAPQLFPTVLVQMVEVGERSGTLPETLLYLAELHETEVDDTTRTLSTLVEPALMIVMGVFIGFIAVSIIAPIYGITQSLHG